MFWRSKGSPCFLLMTQIKYQFNFGSQNSQGGSKLKIDVELIDLHFVTNLCILKAVRFYKKVGMYINKLYVVEETPDHSAIQFPSCNQLKINLYLRLHQPLMALKNCVATNFQGCIKGWSQKQSQELFEKRDEIVQNLTLKK